MSFIDPVFPGRQPIAMVKAPDNLLAELNGLIDFFFPHPACGYQSMQTDAYRKIASRCQWEMNMRTIHFRFTDAYRSFLESLLPGAKELQTQMIRLRAVRPHMEGVQENIGWHRESQYNGPGRSMGPSGEINVWVPLRNVNVNSALQYIPGSDKIPDENLVTEDKVHYGTPPGSYGFDLGLLDVEKKIVGGVDFSKALPLAVLPGEAAIFDGRLLHGSGNNYSDAIRFSVDFRVRGLAD